MPPSGPLPDTLNLNNCWYQHSDPSTHIFPSSSHLKSHPTPDTGGIEKFSAKENFGKILKVSHFNLGFSSNKNHNEIKHSQRVSLIFLDSNLEYSNETICEPENPDENLLEYLILL